MRPVRDVSVPHVREDRRLLSMGSCPFFAGPASKASCFHSFVCIKPFMYIHARQNSLTSYSEPSTPCHPGPVCPCHPTTAPSFSTRRTAPTDVSDASSARAPSPSPLAAFADAPPPGASERVTGQLGSSEIGGVCLLWIGRSLRVGLLRVY